MCAARSSGWIVSEGGWVIRAAIPQELPERLHGLASKLSWEDCVNLLCMYEGWAQTGKSAETRTRSGKLADDMRMLVDALPEDWKVPPPKEHGPITAIAEMLRTGVMPPAPNGRQE